MDRSLTILMPVKNAQDSLAANVAEVLEVASDLTSKLEVVIIDDGSTDATNEIARDLTVHFPQVKVCSHSHSKGSAASIRTGLEQASGEVVVLRDGATRVLDEKVHGPGRPSRPNYLSRLRKFALGE